MTHNVISSFAPAAVFSAGRGWRITTGEATLEKGFSVEIEALFNTPCTPKTRRANWQAQSSFASVSIASVFATGLKGNLICVTFKWSSVRRPFSMKQADLQSRCAGRQTCQHTPKTSFKQLLYTERDRYLAFRDFSRRFSEEGSPGREKIFLRVLLQAAVATAHRAIPRHLRGETLDSNSAASKPPPPKKWTSVSLKNTKSGQDEILGRRCEQKSTSAVKSSQRQTPSSSFRLNSTGMARNSFDCSHVSGERGSVSCAKKKKSPAPLGKTV